MSEQVFSFGRYLAAKKAVDDRALNRHVWNTLRGEVVHIESRPLHVLELGAGIGTMIERTIDWGLLTHADYTALEIDSESLELARERLSDWALGRGLREQKSVEPGHTPLVSYTDSDTLDLRVRFLLGDLLSFTSGPGEERYDLVIAHALLDLLHLPSALPAILGMLKAGGLAYVTINFDGATIFEPTIDVFLDETIESLYHRSMDLRLVDGHPSGDSRTGRHLFGAMADAGAEVIAAGASDWVVHARKGHYPGDEAYFLYHILHFVEQTLRNHPQLDREAFDIWLQTRRRQIEEGTLVYIAHQLDLLARWPGA